MEVAKKYKAFPKMETLYRAERAAFAVYNNITGSQGKDALNKRLLEAAIAVASCEAAWIKWQAIVHAIEMREVE